MPDPNLAALVAVGSFLVLGGLFDFVWRRQAEAEPEFQLEAERVRPPEEAL
jgi:hypothetical protein